MNHDLIIKPNDWCLGLWWVEMAGGLWWSFARIAVPAEGEVVVTWLMQEVTKWQSGNREGKDWKQSGCAASASISIHTRQHQILDRYDGRPGYLPIHGGGYRFIRWVEAGNKLPVQLSLLIIERSDSVVSASKEP